LYCVPGNIDLTGAEIELVHEFAREHKLKEALQSILNDWDYILIDCPPSLGLLTVNAMTASTDVIVPIQCEYYALEGVSQLLTTIRLIQKNLNPGLNILGVLLTMFDKRVNLSMQVAKEVHRYFKEKVFRSVIPRNIKLTEAPSFGKPIFLYDIRSIGAMSYLNLANEVIERYK
ncbi:MAG: ParA family protein, partial [Candidatus Cloacimonetes bacterium]|nr:ParA family protein [Candidatus Cloacimonadota bacterium]